MPWYIYLPIAHHSVALPIMVGLGFVVGLLSGMFGVGGGFLMTPLLIMIGIPPQLRRPLIPTRSWPLPRRACMPTTAWGMSISKWGPAFKFAIGA